MKSGAGIRKRVKFLTQGQVITIHETAIKRYGGESGLLSAEALEDCIRLPRGAFFNQEAYPSLWLKAASLLHCLVTRHPFIDGNKRTGWIAGKFFLFLNGYHLKAETGIAETMVTNVAKGELEISGIVHWIKQHSAPI